MKPRSTKPTPEPPIDEQCIYTCGPYRGYSGRAVFDGAAKLFHGEVLGTRDVITFQGRTVDATRQAFVDSVDDYLALCRERGEEPEKAFSGRFVVRIAPDLHRRLSNLAELQSKSLNALLAAEIEKLVEAPRPRPRSQTRSKPVKTQRMRRSS